MRMTCFVTVLGVGLLFTACESDGGRWVRVATRENEVALATPDGYGSDSHVDTVNIDDTGATETGGTTDASDATGPTDTADTHATDTATTDTATTDTGPDTDTPPTDPRPRLPSHVAIPWVAAGAGTRSVTVQLVNDGGAGPVTVSLSGDASLHLSGAPTMLAAGGSATLTLTFDGASTPDVAHAVLAAEGGGVRVECDVWAVAGDSDLPAASWSDLTSATGGIRYGRTATVKLASAPYPEPGGSWTDSSVNVFVPDGYADRGAVEAVVHFHGHSTTIAETLAHHLYREQLWASGKNAILVTPQGPVNAASGNFGKLMDDGGLEALLADVVSILYRDGLVGVPALGDLVLTEHSGGYQAVAVNLDVETDAGRVQAAHLFDGLYGYSSNYEAFVRAGGFLRSDYSTLGGTLPDNQALCDKLGGLCVEDPSAANLRDHGAVIWFTPAVHGDTTWWEQSYSESLRWGANHSRRGPRVELRTAVATAGEATVTWIAPNDDEVLGFTIETATATGAWTWATSVGPDAQAASFALSGGGAGTRVRVAPVMADVPADEVVASDGYWVGDGGRVLVVDGFDRIFGGSYRDIRHDATARVGAALEAGLGAHAASNEAVVEGEIALGDYDVVVWLVGDESTADHTFTADEQALITAYLSGGGRVIVSGSEVGYDLKSNGSAFLSGLGGTYVSDDAGVNGAKGAGALAAVASFTFGDAAAPYAEDYPDVLGAASGATVVLQYSNGMTAAVGKASRSVVVGFPLEVVSDPSAHASLVQALVTYVRP